MSAVDPNSSKHGPVRAMFRRFDRLTGYVDTVARAAIALGIFGVFVLLVLQVLVRYILPFPLPWVEEAAVYLSGYVALIGASVCLRAGFHLQVDLLRDLLGMRAQVALLVFQQALVIGFGLFIVRYGFAFVQLGWGQTSPSSYFLVSYARMAMPIGGALLALQALVVAGRAIEEYGDAKGPPDTPPGARQMTDT